MEADGGGGGGDPMDQGGEVDAAATMPDLNPREDDDDEEEEEEEEEEEGTEGGPATTPVALESSADVVVATLGAHRSLVDEQMPQLKDLLRSTVEASAKLSLEIEALKGTLMQCVSRDRGPSSPPLPTIYEAEEVIERVHRAHKAFHRHVAAWTEAANETTENFFIFPVNATINHVTRQLPQTTPVLTHTQHFFPMAVAFDTAIHTSAALPTASPQPPLNMMPMDMFGGL